MCHAQEYPGNHTSSASSKSMLVIGTSVLCRVRSRACRSHGRKCAILRCQVASCSRSMCRLDSELSRFGWAGCNTNAGRLAFDRSYAGTLNPTLTPSNLPYSGRTYIIQRSHSNIVGSHNHQATSKDDVSLHRAFESGCLKAGANDVALQLSCILIMMGLHDYGGYLEGSYEPARLQ